MHLTNEWPYSNMFTNEWQYLSGSTNEWQYLSGSTNEWQYLSGSTNEWQYLKVVLNLILCDQCFFSGRSQMLHKVWEMLTGKQN